MRALVLGCGEMGSSAVNDLYHYGDLDEIIVGTRSIAKARSFLESLKGGDTKILPEEIEVLYDWVNDGGSLLMVIDHMPFGGSFEDLAGAFGIEVSNGLAVDERFLSGYSDEVLTEASYLVLRRTDGTLVNHPILDDTEPYGRIEFLASWAGSAFRLPAHAFSLITFGPNILSLEPEVSWEFDSMPARRRVTGWSQAGVIEVGKGRVAVLGDNLLFIEPAFLAPLLWDSEKDAAPHRLGHNAQFTLNLLHWLSGQ